MNWTLAMVVVLRYIFDELSDYLWYAMLGFAIPAYFFAIVVSAMFNISSSSKFGIAASVVTIGVVYVLGLMSKKIAQHFRMIELRMKRNNLR